MQLPTREFAVRLVGLINHAVPRVKLLPVMDVLAAVVEHLAVNPTVVVPNNFSVRESSV